MDPVLGVLVAYVALLRGLLGLPFQNDRDDEDDDESE
jgi:hypothetical protein